MKISTLSFVITSLLYSLANAQEIQAPIQAPKQELVKAVDDGRKILGTTTIIKAALSQKLISDYPGPFRAYVTHDVYDSTYEYVLIPKGSKIHGNVVRIANVNEPISARVGYIIHSIIRPDNVLVDLSRDAAVDHEGVSGIEDEVNRHLLAQFLGVVAYALVSSGSDGQTTGGLTGTVNTNAEIAAQTREQFSPIAQKYLNLVPTVTINSGQTFNVFIVAPKRITPYGGIFDDFASN
ncbi:TrbI/VirB10 family protein [Paraglaciecola sp. 20A4]|uniref:TrbI/VirB10 family protein n=1 Tax=Paraglaciecola sp. 20A4 TaxID=2687288 RepID=UPI00140A8A65|nr:TrbI/VirB10 family protein [Paraglaciecola sp. 20A4]